MVRFGFVVLLALLNFIGPARAGEREPLRVFAAASLQEALDAATAAWSARSGQRVLVSYGASSTLARQVAQGAPADLFLSADHAWMDDLERRGLLRPGTRADLLGNRLVVIVPARSPRTRLAPVAADWREALGPAGRLAVAEVEAVPAGRYARQSLQALGLWPLVRDRLAPGDSVRTALAFVARGEAPLGIVYATDARAEPAVRVVSELPAHTHEAIVYPVAETAGSAPGSAGLRDFLRGPEARAIFAHFGFTEP